MKVHPRGGFQSDQNSETDSMCRGRPGLSKVTVVPRPKGLACGQVIRI